MLMSEWANRLTILPQSYPAFEWDTALLCRTLFLPVMAFGSSVRFSFEEGSFAWPEFFNWAVFCGGSNA